MEFSVDKIEFKMVHEPERWELYFQFQNNTGFLVLVIDGQYLVENGRLSNSWSWVNVNTCKKEYGYGCFYEIYSLKSDITDEEPEKSETATAHWERKTDVSCYSCSNCGEGAIVQSGHCGFSFETLTKYCPNCGAKMKMDDSDDGMDKH